MRTLGVMFSGLGVGQILAEAAITGSVRAWIAFALTASGIALYMAGRNSDESKLLSDIRRIASRPTPTRPEGQERDQ